MTPFPAVRLLMTTTPAPSFPAWKPWAEVAVQGRKKGAKRSGTSGRPMAVAATTLLLNSPFRPNVSRSVCPVKPIPLPSQSRGHKLRPLVRSQPRPQRCFRRSGPDSVPQPALLATCCRSPRTQNSAGVSHTCQLAACQAAPSRALRLPGGAPLVRSWRGFAITCDAPLRRQSAPAASGRCRRPGSILRRHFDPGWWSDQLLSGQDTCWTEQA